MREGYQLPVRLPGRGGCGFCKVRLILGEVRYERPIAARVLTDDERVEGVCLSCRAVPLTNVVIELQEGDRLRRSWAFGNFERRLRPQRQTKRERKEPSR